MEEKEIKNVEDLIRKFHETKKQEKLDLSSDEDLSLAIMNLISIEEHFFFTAEKTEKRQYFDLLKEVREIRKELLKKIIKDYEGEVWCISKHLLASSMRLMEVGTKSLSQNKKQEAYDLFDKAYRLYNLFWALNLKIIDTGEIKKIDDNAINVHDKEKKGFWGKLGTTLKNLLDCCKE